MKTTLASSILCFSAATLGLSVAAAQTTPDFAVPPYKNLKVIPQNISRGDLLADMKFFSQSLGVRCTHCHVGEDDKPLSTLDYASDAKTTKLVARSMLTMVQKINHEEFGVEDLKNAKVTCFTCHRGSAEPLTAPPPPVAVPPATVAPKTERG